eukprot:CAMPEP_0119305294 /NCGR_PEP_ID=MMETSP1333-20130426/6327_1 /TAXON_ID=418940 /ORGANISM="Scyphosphaera apsteinii, Strain RCC1455" /LENGTH=216 /DNA_ID=CAMNT_0007308355 /DNA_START=126 /DNA_END=776 /DNA_ORIENTATION=-
MARALSRLGGNETSRRVGQHYSQANRERVQSRLEADASQGIVPLRPDEQEAMHKRNNSKYKTNSERGINVPRVGQAPRYEPPPLVAFVPHRRTGEEIREANDNFEPAPLPPYVPTRSNEERKDELARKNEWHGKTPEELAAMKSVSLRRSRPSASTSETTEVELRSQIADEVAERQEFLETMQKLGRGAEYESQIRNEIAERLADLKKLDSLAKVS